ncbi:MAG: hypothetical protein ABFE13_26030 [Phycisphaerales bacterium]
MDMRCHNSRWWTIVVPALAMGISAAGLCSDVAIAPLTVAGDPQDPCTVDFLIVDDFESYESDSDFGHAIWETWYERYLAPCCDIPANIYASVEFETVHSGRHSMAVSYDNRGWLFYSKIVREWGSQAQSVPQDWTLNGFDTLVLHVHGCPTNAAEPLYVAIEDARSGHATAAHPDPNVILASKWIEWRIPLNSLAGVDMTNVGQLGIGIGQYQSLVPGGAGRIYVDDIRIARAGSLPSLLAARDIYPLDGDVNVPHSLTLRWSAGESAAFHDVYFADDANAVAEAAPTTAGVYRSRQPLDEPTFDPGSLEWNKTYYWRIDEGNDADPENPQKGTVWSFTTADFLVLDDFESYTHDEGCHIYETWIEVLLDCSDCWPEPATSTEYEIVHSGRQAMALDYNDAWISRVGTLEWQPLWPEMRDWTVNGVNTLVLYVEGQSTNDPEPLRIVVGDYSGRSSTALHPDPNVTRASEWIEWKIPLSCLADVNLAEIKWAAIGLGQPENPTPGVAGRIYIDDIRLIRQ